MGDDTHDVCMHVWLPMVTAPSPAGFLALDLPRIFGLTPCLAPHMRLRQVCSGGWSWTSLTRPFDSRFGEAHCHPSRSFAPGAADICTTRPWPCWLCLPTGPELNSPETPEIPAPRKAAGHTPHTPIPRCCPHHCSPVPALPAQPQSPRSRSQAFAMRTTTDPSGPCRHGPGCLIVPASAHRLTDGCHWLLDPSTPAPPFALPPVPKPPPLSRARGYPPGGRIPPFCDTPYWFSGADATAALDSYRKRPRRQCTHPSERLPWYTPPPPGWGIAMHGPHPHTTPSRLNAAAPCNPCPANISACSVRARGRSAARLCPRRQHCALWGTCTAAAPAPSNAPDASPAVPAGARTAAVVPSHPVPSPALKVCPACYLLARSAT
jgi:hypothetical protein